jgi:class 3 adenylate cyclase
VVTTPAEGSSFRGFLFADLRAYTAYVERHGNRAAAELLARYRTLVRTEVERHHGAEIKTEGDSFYVAYPSARGAVECGLAIVAAADRASSENPAHPIHVGIGIHAGETVETGDGYVGSAVNIAARVAGQAKAGEVLVTGTVRELVRGNVDANFEARGRHRLKGVDGEVALFTARVGAMGAIPRRSTVRSRRVVETVLAAVALLVVVGAGSRLLGGSPPASPEPSATQPVAASSAPTTFEDVEPDSRLAPGDYVLHYASIGGAQAFPTLSISFTLPAGWDRVRADGLLWNDAGARLGFAVVDNLYVDPCDPDRGLREPAVGPSVDDLTRALTSDAEWQAAEVTEGFFFGFAGNHVALTAPAALSSCAEESWRFLHTLGNPGYVPAFSSERVDTWILNVAGTRLVIAANSDPQLSGRVRAELQAIIDSIRIEP